jgi:hypothetical protein
MAIDTVFIAYCEDSEENDGLDRPYFMSRQLMEVMQELKLVSEGGCIGWIKNVEAGER